MKKILKSIRELLPLFALSLLFALLFAPLPAVVIEILICFDYCFALYLFLKTHINKNIDLIRFLRLIQFFCLLNCSAAIASIRSFLCITSIEDQIPIIVIVGSWICNENHTAGFLITILMCYLIVEFCSSHVKRAAKAFDEKLQEQKNAFYNEINNKQFNGEITDIEALEQKVKYNDKTYYYGELTSAGKYLTGTIKTFILLYVITAAGGTAVGILEIKLPWEEALDQYIMLSTGYLVFFIIPLFLASLSFRTK